jgi:hypothetical protein
MPFQDREICQEYLNREGRDLTVSDTDWLCPTCYKVSTTPPPQSVPKHIKNVKQCIQTNLQELVNCGYVLCRTMVCEFKVGLQTAKLTFNFNVVDKDVIQSYENKLTFEMSNNANIKCINHDTGNKVIGTMFYHKEKICTKAATDLYNLLYDKAVTAHKLTSSVNEGQINIQDIANMIEAQTKLFTKAESAYDYRKLFNNINGSQETWNGDSYFLGSFLHKPLSIFLEKILNIKVDATDNRIDLKTHKACLKIPMAIGILFNI